MTFGLRDGIGERMRRASTGTREVGTSSKADSAGQGDPRRAALALISCAVLAAGCEKAPEGGRQTPSGLDVPRWVSLAFDESYARAGPAADHKILWVYRAKGLPVQVVAETREWRKICDPEGRSAWIHRRLTDGRRNIMRTAAEPLPLRDQPRDGARTSAVLAGRAIAALERCEGDWCRVKAGGTTGWAPARELWGVAETSQCR